MEKCKSCGFSIRPGAIFCTKCGLQIAMPKHNACTNLLCQRYKDGVLFASDEMYCDQCGKPTTFGGKVAKLL